MATRESLVTLINPSNSFLNRSKQRYLYLSSDGHLHVSYPPQHKKYKTTQETLWHVDLLQCEIHEKLVLQSNMYCVRVGNLPHHKTLYFGFEKKLEAFTWLTSISQAVDDNSNGQREWKSSFTQALTYPNKQKHSSLRKLPPRDWYQQWLSYKSRDESHEEDNQHPLKCQTRQMTNFWKEFWTVANEVVYLYSTLPDEERYKLQSEVPAWFRDTFATPGATTVFMYCGILFQEASSHWKGYKMLKKECAELADLETLLGGAPISFADEGQHIQLPLFASIELNGIRYVAFANPFLGSCGVEKKVLSQEDMTHCNQDFFSGELMSREYFAWDVFSFENRLSVLMRIRGATERVCANDPSICGFYVSVKEGIPIQFLSHEELIMYKHRFKSAPTIPYIGIRYFCHENENKVVYNSRASLFAQRDLAGDVVIVSESQPRLNNAYFQEAASTSLSHSSEAKIIRQKVVEAANEFRTSGDPKGKKSVKILNGRYLAIHLNARQLPLRYLPSLYHYIHWDKPGLRRLVAAEIVARAAKHLIRHRVLSSLNELDNDEIFETHAIKWRDIAAEVMLAILKIEDSFWQIHFPIWTQCGPYHSAPGVFGDELQRWVSDHPTIFIQALGTVLNLDFAPGLLRHLLSARIIPAKLGEKLVEKPTRSKHFGKISINAALASIDLNTSLEETATFMYWFQRLPFSEEYSFEHVIRNALKASRNSNHEQLPRIIQMLSCECERVLQTPSILHIFAEHLLAYFLLFAALNELRGDFSSLSKAEKYYSKAWIWLRYLYRPTNNGQLSALMPTHPIGEFLSVRIQSVLQKLVTHERDQRNLGEHCLAEDITARQEYLKWITALIKSNGASTQISKSIEEFFREIEDTLLYSPSGVDLHKNVLCLDTDLPIAQNTVVTSRENNGDMQRVILNENGSVYTYGPILGLSIEEEQILRSAVKKPDSKETNTIDFVFAPVIPSVPIKDVSCGHRHTALVAQNGTCFTFGLGSAGRLGHGDEQTQLSPKAVDYFLSERLLIHKVACGRDHTLVATTDGALYGFGWGEAGRLGCGEIGQQLLPLEVTRFKALNEKIVELACGREHSIVGAASGNVYSFGVGAEGCLGNGKNDDEHFPYRVTFEPHLEGRENSPVISLAAGDLHSIAITAEGSIYTWGFGESMATGRLKTERVPRLLQLSNKSRAVKAACGSFHSLLVLEDGRVYEFGDSLGPEVEPVIEKAIDLDEAAEGIAAGESSSWVVTTSGKVYSWGASIDSSTILSKPECVSSRALRVLACGSYHVVGVTGGLSG